MLTFTPDELIGRPAEAALHALETSPGARAVAMAPLEDAAQAEALASALGRDPQEVRELTDRVIEAADGHLGAGVQLLGELAAQRLDLVGQADVAFIVDQGQQPIAKLQTQLIKRQRRRNGFFFRGGLGRFFCLAVSGFLNCSLVFLGQGISRIGKGRSQQRKGQEGQARHQPHGEQQRA